MDKIKKIVITGGPCCGKSTVLNKLRSMGAHTVSETAREVLSETGKHPDYQKDIFERQLEKEKKANTEISFLDRGAIDGLAYVRLLKDANSFTYDKEDLKKRYHKVFVLERLPLKNDEIRQETEEEAQEIHNTIISLYEEFEYDIVHIPQFEGTIEESVQKRAEFILNKIKECEDGVH